MGIKEDFQDLTPAKCLVLGFVLCVVYYFVFYNKGDDILASSGVVQEEINGVQKRMADIEEALNNQAEFEKKVVEFTKELEELLKFFPSNLNLNEMQKEFTEKLRITENKLIRIQEVSVQSRFVGYKEHGIEIEIVGGFHEIMSFLSAITKMSRVVDFLSMELDAQNPTDDLSLVKFRLKMSIFAQEKVKKENKLPEAVKQ